MRKSSHNVHLQTENGHKMSRLELILIFVLQVEAGVRGEAINRYISLGHDVTLSCDREPVSDTTCSNIYWIFDSERSPTVFDVKEGKLQKISTRANRLSLDSDCSLVINNITTEDAGRYICRQGKNGDDEMTTYLNVLTISLSPPDADPEKDGEVTLVCSLLTYMDISRCQQNSIRWMDETRTVLNGEGVGYKLLGQNNCNSFLTVKRQSGNNRRYICLFLVKGKAVVETDYTPDFKDDKRDDQPGKTKPDGVSNQTPIIIGAVVGSVVLLLVIAAVVIKYRKRAEVTDGGQKPTNRRSDEPENNLTYVTINHPDPQTSKKRKAKEEDVTYSTVKTQ